MQDDFDLDAYFERIGYDAAATAYMEIGRASCRERV